MKKRLLIPVSIIVAGAIVATAVYGIAHKDASHSATNAGNPSLVRPVDASDHILGNPAAPIVFVEYSDIDSPFCKIFDQTMESIVSAYGEDGKVAWVYRSLPSIGTDPGAESNAEAAECVASISNPGEFFTFIDRMRAAAPGAAEFDPQNYASLVQGLGLDTDAFASCMQQHTFAGRVARDATNGLAAGAAGTPYTILLIKGEKPIPISGALSYEQMNNVVVGALTKLQQE